MSRPEGWNFAMDFLGPPEDEMVEGYVAALEAELDSLAARCAQWEEYAGRLEDHFTALADVMGGAEPERARKTIAAEAAVCFAGADGERQS